MALSCQLPPPVFEKLYESLRDAPYPELLRTRLGLIGRDDSWLQEMSEGYRRIWEYRKAYLPDELFAGMDGVHSELACWLTAVLPGSSSEFSRALNGAVRAVYEQAEMEGHALPATLPRVAVVAWVLGSVPGNYDRELPVVFAIDPPDSNVQPAYDGLAQHLVDIAEVSEPWAEVATSAVFWRCAGIAEGLAPQVQPNLESSLNHLMATVRDRVADTQWRAWAAYWIPFRKTRNALTHLTGQPNPPAFADVYHLATGREHVRDSLNGATLFVANSIRLTLTDPDSDQGRTRMAEAAEDEFRYLPEIPT